MRRRGTATGAPATWFGYYLGQLLCRLGRHDTITLRRWTSVPGRDHVTMMCNRDRCEWSIDRWERSA